MSVVKQSLTTQWSAGASTPVCPPYLVTVLTLQKCPVVLHLLDPPGRRLPAILTDLESVDPSPSSRHSSHNHTSREGRNAIS